LEIGNITNFAKTQFMVTWSDIELKIGNLAISTFLWLLYFIWIFSWKSLESSYDAKKAENLLSCTLNIPHMCSLSELSFYKICMPVWRICPFTCNSEIDGAFLW
jgi:hypothetical protein